jgi:hypothetical protein
MPSRVETVIQSAWQRRLFVIACEQLAIAVAIVLGGGILLLLLGTQILDWYWLLLLGVVGVGVAVYRTRARLVGHYRVAQLLDSRLKLTDSLSTAWHLLSQKEQSAVAQFQLAYAEKAAEQVEVDRAFPFAGQRLWVIAGGLAAVMFGLFAARYLVTNSLSLSQSIVPLHLSDVVERVERAFAGEKKLPPDMPDTDRANNVTPPSNARKDAEKQAQQQLPKPEAAKADGGNSGQGQAERSEMQPPKEGDAGKQEKREGSNGTAQSREGEKAEQNEQQAGAKPPEKGEQGNNQQDAAGLMDKMKDALSSLMAKMKNSQQRPQDQGQKPAEDQKAEDQQQAGKEQNGTPQQSAQNKQSDEQQQTSEGQSQSQTTEKTKAGQGRSSDQSNDKKNQEAHSGMGRQDGGKQLRDAEQLKAMGKLAEIIGKRSANLTGDMMVENPSNKQQLKTEYSQRTGNHADLGGEINRDEIPLAYQQYVREYMEKVRAQKSGK